MSFLALGLPLALGLRTNHDTMLHTIERHKIDPNRLYGVIVTESDEFLLIHREYDFQFDGYLVIRRRDITKSFTSDSNKYCERLMKKEGLWKRATKTARALPLENWHTILTALEGNPVVIEDERKGDFVIGPILECDARSVAIYNFDGCGQWQRIERVQYRAISSVQFGSRYITIHSRHLPPRPNKSVNPSGE